MIRILLLISIAITVYAFVDCARTEQEEVQRLPKWAWLLLIVLFAPITNCERCLVGDWQKTWPRKWWLPQATAEDYSAR